MGKLKEERIQHEVKEKMEYYARRNFKDNMDDMNIDDVYDKFENTIENSLHIIKRRNQLSRMKIPSCIREKITLRNKLRKDENRNIDELNTLRAIIKKEIRTLKNNPRPPINTTFIISNCNENLKIMRSSMGNNAKKVLNEEEMKKLLQDSYPDASYEMAPLSEILPHNIDNKDIFIIQTYEIRAEIKFLRNGKSSGPSFIKAEILKLLTDSLIDVLKYIFNRIIKKGLIPNAWKRITLACVPKGNNEVRPIGITNQVRKVFEKIILNRINISFIQNQGGFIKRIGTQNHAIIMDDLLRHSNGKAIVVALDIKKAYDTVDRAILYRKLHNKFKVPFKMITLLYELLEHNIIELKQGEISLNKSLTLGLPQGCVLSPMLFNVFINDIIENMGCDSRNLLLYADDILIISDNEIIIRRMISEIETHSINNNYRLNPKKCNFMTSKEIELQIYGVNIEKVIVLKYLGYYFNLKGLDLRENINTIRSKIFARAAMIKRFVHSSNIVNPLNVNTSALLVNHYKTYCRPIIDYFISLMSSYKTLIYKSEILQKGIVKFLFGFVHRFPTKLLYSLIEIEMIEFRSFRLMNGLRKRIESLNEEYLCKVIYLKSNTKIIKNIKNMALNSEFQEHKDEELVKVHCVNNKIIGGISISSIRNKRELLKFIKIMNSKVKKNMNERNYDLLYEYIRHNMHKFI